MVRIARVLIDGLLLRCPRCHRGHVFSSWFKMRRECEQCGLPFERASGEITGGMGISIAVTLLLVIVASALIGFSSVPLLPAFAVMGVLTLAFPIVFYPMSRGVWLGILYLTDHHAEPD